MSEKQEPYASTASERTFVTALNRKGGVGRSFLMMLVEIALKKAGRDPIVMSLDRLGGAAMLRGDFPVVAETMPGRCDFIDYPNAIRTGFSRLRSTILDHPHRDVLCDFDAGASVSFPEYASRTRFEEFSRAQGLRPVFTVPYTPHPTAIEGAFEMVEALRQLFDEPKIVGVEIRRGARPTGALETICSASRTAFENIGRHVLVKPLPPSAELLLQSGVRLDEALDLDTSALSRILGMPDDFAQMLRASLRNWLHAHVDLLIRSIT